MQSRDSTWIHELAESIGVSLDNSSIIKTVWELAQRNWENNPPAWKSPFEFSFIAGNASKASFRYIINTSQWKTEDVKEILSMGFKCVDFSSLQKLQKLKRFLKFTYGKYETKTDRDKGCRLGAIGVEHLSDGSISSLKTYWDYSGLLEDLQYLLQPSERKEYIRLLGIIRGLWPKWNKLWVLGIDFTASDSLRVKAYFPPKEAPEPLSLLTFLSFLINIGIETDVDNLSKLAYFCLNKEFEVVPTAYILGLNIGKSPSVKLEIAAQAYFKKIEEALKATSVLATSMNIDPTPFYIGISALQKHSPLKRPPTLEVISLEFMPAMRNKMAIYCRL